MKIISHIAAIALVVCAASVSAGPLLTANELQALTYKQNTLIIDIRPSAAFAKEHIGGAVSAPYGRWRGPSNNPGQLRGLDDFTKLLQRIGVAADKKIVVVATGHNAVDFSATARVYWTLKTLGLTNLAILNGGLTAWKVNDLPLTNNITVVIPTQYTPTGFNRRYLEKRHGLAAQLGDDKLLLMDARVAGAFLGKTRSSKATLAGTIPGAVRVTFKDFFEPGSGVLDITKAKRLLASIGPIKDGQQIVSFCNTGHKASTNWFAFSEILGQPVKLYPGSMVDWTNSEQRLPIQGPGRLGQLIVDAKIWWKNL